MKNLQKKSFVNESDQSDDALAELLTLTMEVNQWGTTVYQNQQGQTHRVHGPAVTQEDGSEFWFQHDLLHRIDGPAVVSSNGTKKWYRNDELHRTDGPAVIWYESTKFWFLDGKQLTEEEFHERIR